MLSYEKWIEYRLENNLRNTKDFFNKFKEEYNYNIVKDNKRIENVKIAGKCYNCDNEYSKLFKSFIMSGPICDKCRGWKSNLLKDTYPLIYSQIYSVPNNIDKLKLTVSSSKKIIWQCVEKCTKCNDNHKYEQIINKKIISRSNCLICIGHTKCPCQNKDEFKCYKCLQIKTLDNRSTQSFNKNICKKCVSEKYNNNLMSFFKYLLNLAKGHTKIRNNKNRNHNFDITIDNLIELYNKQEGKCAISDIPLKIELLVDWRCSIERINNNIGYVNGNVALICTEFQTGIYQWSKDKWNEFCCHYLYSNENIFNDNEIIETEINNALNPIINYNKSNRTIKKDNKFYCFTCKVFKTKDNMRYNTLCKSCRNYNDKINENLRSKFLKFIYRMSKTTKDRNNKNTANKRDNTMTLTFEELIDIYKQQNGRCYYSNIPLFLNDEYMMSPERLDVFKGYTKENTVLICAILNIADRSVSSLKTSGSLGWNKEKLKYAVSLNNIAYPKKITIEDALLK